MSCPPECFGIIDNELCGHDDEIVQDAKEQFILTDDNYDETYDKIKEFIEKREPHGKLYELMEYVLS